MDSSKPSKSAKKRENLALQELGEQLILLDAGTLERLPLDDRLRAAVTDARSMTSRGALRRQKQLIGKLMRSADVDAIRDTLAQDDADDRLRRQVFRQAEQWRDRMFRDGLAAVREFGETTGRDTAQLARLVADLDAGMPQREEKHLRREVFRHVHDELLARTRDDRIPR